MILLLARLLLARSPGMTMPYATKLVKLGLIVAAVAVAVGGFTWWLAGREEAAVEADRNAAAVEVGVKVRKADGAAGEAVANTKQETERTNDEARRAAEGSDDPLADALRSLRGK